MSKQTLAIIGPGVVGRALAALLRRKRYRIGGVAGTSPRAVRAAIEFIGAGRLARSADSAVRGADVVFITTPDRVIRAVGEEVAASKSLKRGAIVIHCNGANDASLLDAVRRRQAHAVALHPLQSFATPEAAVKRMKGTYFTFDGDEQAAPVVEEIVQALGGRMIRLTGDKALYHAACCVLSNYLVALVDMGLNLLHLSGMSRSDAVHAAQPLLDGTIDNIEMLGVPAALTGPIARGDAQTVGRHLQALAAMPRDVRQAYCSLGIYTIRVAQRKGTLEPAQARELQRILTAGVRG